MATSEEIFRKAFASMGSPIAGEREAALQVVYGLLDKRTSSPRSFVDLLDALENNVPKSAYEELADKLRQSEQRADDLDADNARLARQVAGLKALVLFQSHWRRWVGAAVVLAAVVGIHAWRDRVTGAPERVAVAATLGRDLANDHWGLGYSHPVVATAAGKQWWTLLWGGVDHNHADSEGRPVALHCLHLYAAPAVAESGVYRKPKPFGVLGQLHWPERSALCRLAPDEDISK